MESKLIDFNWSTRITKVNQVVVWKRYNSYKNQFIRKKNQIITNLILLLKKKFLVPISSDYNQSWSCMHWKTTRQIWNFYLLKLIN